MLRKRNMYNQNLSIMKNLKISVNKSGQIVNIKKTKFGSTYYYQNGNIVKIGNYVKF